MWVSCTRASGFLQSCMICMTVGPSESLCAHTNVVTQMYTYALIWMETKQCMIHVLDYLRTQVKPSQTGIKTDTLHSQRAARASCPSPTVLCVSSMCQTVSVLRASCYRCSCDTNTEMIPTRRWTGLWMDSFGHGGPWAPGMLASLWLLGKQAHKNTFLLLKVFPHSVIG